MDQTGATGCEARLLEQLDALAAAEAQLLAERVDVLVELHAASVLLQRGDGVERCPELDVAATLRVGQVAAGLRVAEAHRLHAVLTRTLAGLRSGSVLVPQALILLRETRSCSEPVAADTERRVFTGLGPDGLAPWFAGDLTRRVKRAVLQAEAALEPDATAQREADARQDRRVVVRSEPDAMGSLWALLPAEQLRAFTLGLDELTRRQKQADLLAGVDRTLDQRRADLLALLPALALHALDGTTPSADGSHPAVVVDVHVPLATALGLSDAPGVLKGYGPISAGTARLLLPGAKLRRVLVDEHTGEVLHVAGRTTASTASTAQPARSQQQRQHQQQREPADGVLLDGPCQPLDDEGTTERTPPPAPAGLPDGPLRRALLSLVPDSPVLVDDTPELRYRPSAALDRLVRTRDPHCTGLGCTRPARDGDLDHRVPWPLGPTSAGNLAPLSRRCHRAKTLSWGLRRLIDGSSTWTSPTGRRYTSPSPWDPPPGPDEHRPTPPPRDDAPRWCAPADGDAAEDLTGELDRTGDLNRTGYLNGSRDLPPRARPAPRGLPMVTSAGLGTALADDDPPPF